MSGQRVPGTDRRVLHEVGVGGQGGVEGVDARQLPVVDDTARAAAWAASSGLGDDGRDRLAVVVDPAVGEHRAVGVRDAEPRHRGRQVGRGDHVDHAGDRAAAAVASMPSTSAQPTGTVTRATCSAPGKRRSARNRCAPDARSPPPYRSTGRPT